MKYKDPVAYMQCSESKCGATWFPTKGHECDLCKAKGFQVTGRMTVLSKQEFVDWVFDHNQAQRIMNDKEKKEQEDMKKAQEAEQQTRKEEQTEHVSLRVVS